MSANESPAYGVESEVGRLRSVMLHRPGGELRRLTPRNNGALLFDGIPWVERAQDEHDRFAATLLEHSVEVLYVGALLTECLYFPDAREQIITSVTADPRLGQSLAASLRGYLSDLDPERLTAVLIEGLTKEEFGDSDSLRGKLMRATDFVIDPLPNMMFTRDSSVWIGDAVAVTSLAMPARRRETALTGIVYHHHPRFTHVPKLYDPSLEHLEGGDVLALAPGVLAVGVGERTTPAGAERLARKAFELGTIHTLLVVPIAQRRATMHLDTVCTMVDDRRMVMYAPAERRLEAYTVRLGDDGELDIEGPRGFLDAAADAMGIDRIEIIHTGERDVVTAEREQWDDGNNTLALAQGVAVAYERNTVTNGRLERAGIKVLTIPGSELGSGRGGPRCMSCPITREHPVRPAQPQEL
ncbi:arginine deiminase [Glycomyces buryatensis]|uniref:Arginine deiminase n=1 Tax=Glycomyces buryatensis TaxID=2570927 RepID=A0A4S8QGZ4_9ACTN|nr:arginine deiminase [Glycomyces buryatensis]THV40659.1 arginine deiminase [Glycomyces buryatensis]